jgi:hypothetical protein
VVTRRAQLNVRTNFRSTQPAPRLTRQLGQPRRDLALVYPELLGIMPPRRIEPAHLLGQIEQSSGQAPSDAAGGWLAWHQAVAHVSRFVPPTSYVSAGKRTAENFPHCRQEPQRAPVVLLVPVICGKLVMAALPREGGPGTEVAAVADDPASVMTTFIVTQVAGRKPS